LKYFLERLRSSLAALALPAAPEWPAASEGLKGKSFSGSASKNGYENNLAMIPIAIN
jgi:hypothetical protein